MSDRLSGSDRKVLSFQVGKEKVTTRRLNDLNRQKEDLGHKWHSFSKQAFVVEEAIKVIESERDGQLQDIEDKMKYDDLPLLARKKKIIIVRYASRLEKLNLELEQIREKLREVDNLITRTQAQIDGLEEPQPE